MKEQKARPDKHTLPMNRVGAALAVQLTEMFLEDGRTVVDEVVEIIPGVRVRQLTVLGKRPGEGQIARDVKARRG